MEVVKFNVQHLGPSGLSAFEEWKIRTNQPLATWEDFMESIGGGGSGGGNGVVDLDGGIAFDNAALLKSYDGGNAFGNTSANVDGGNAFD